MTLPTFEEARRIVEHHAATIRPARTESVPLLQSAGRVLAESIAADRDLPPFPRATRDGFALRAEDVAQAPVALRVVSEIRAGMDTSNLSLRPGECAEIMTGAAVPKGADAVVMVEYSIRTGDQVQIQRRIQTGDNIVPCGSEARAGMKLLPRASRLTPAAIALAASFGVDPVSAFSKPTVAILSTGDEVVPVHDQPLPHQIRNSNTYSLAAQVANAGGIPVPLPIAPDEPERLRALIQQGFESDLLLMTGGVSMGKYDLVEPVLCEIGAEFFFTGAQIQPGKPIVFGRLPVSQPQREALGWGWKYFFGLPGNPVSTMVTFELFARPVIDALCGAQPTPLRFLNARLKSDARTGTGLTRFLPAKLSGEFAAAEVELIHWRGSGDVASTSRADCFAVLPPDRGHIPAGEFIPVLSL